MSVKERERLVIFGQVRSLVMSRKEAAEILGLSLRQMHRVYPRWLKEGDRSLAHRARGRLSSRRRPESQRVKAMNLYRELYPDFGPTLFAEKLTSEHEIRVSHDTARRWLIHAGLHCQRRAGRRSRKRRIRKERFGQMVQMDGSIHHWFESRGPRAVLMTVIDDATGIRRGRFFTGETFEAAAESFIRWCKEFGIPRSLYVDRHGNYRCDRDPTPEEIQQGKKPMTHFGQAMHELHVELILAHSPQAKGRVERNNRTLQDRLIKELRLANINSIEQANAWLERTGYFQQLDEKFAVSPVNPKDAHRPLVHNLDEVFATKHPRRVGHDGCIYFKSGVLQLENPGLLKQVTVWEYRDGSVQIHAKGKQLSYHRLDQPTRRRGRPRLRIDPNEPISQATIQRTRRRKPMRKQMPMIQVLPAIPLRKAG